MKHAVKPRTSTRSWPRLSLRSGATAATAALLGLGALLQPSSAAASPFTIVAIGNVQYLTEFPPPNLFSGMMQHIAHNAALSNIVFTTLLGSVTYGGDEDEYWDYVSDDLATLDGVVPYSVTFGDHDIYDDPGHQSLANALAFAADRRHEGGATFGGASPDGLSFYQTFSAAGFALLHLNLKGQPDASTLSWAYGVATSPQNLGKPTILSTNDYLLKADAQGTVRRSLPGEYIWNHLVKDTAQIFMVLSAHDHAQSRLMSIDSAGRNVIQIEQDYESFRPIDALREMTFDPGAAQIRVNTYSPQYGTYVTGAQHQFVLDAGFDLANNRISIGGSSSSPGQTAYAANFASPTIQGDLDALVQVGQTGALSTGANAAYQWTSTGVSLLSKYSAPVCLSLNKGGYTGNGVFGDTDAALDFRLVDQIGGGAAQTTDPSAIRFIMSSRQLPRSAGLGNTYPVYYVEYTGTALAIREQAQYGKVRTIAQTSAPVLDASHGYRLWFTTTGTSPSGDVNLRAALFDTNTGIALITLNGTDHAKTGSEEGGSGFDWALNGEDVHTSGRVAFCGGSTRSARFALSGIRVTAFSVH